MINFLVATGVILIYFISAYGWGGLANRYLYASSTHSIAYDVSLGLAIWIFLGGLLNALGLAYTIALDSIFILGILMLVVLVIKLRHRKKFEKQRLLHKMSFVLSETSYRRILTDAVPLLIIGASVSLFIITLLPSNAFNHHDDFYKYFPRLFRMIQSGRLGGTPFDYVGIDSLGAHSFLQSFVAAHFPLQYINGFDDVFCFLLGGMLLNDIGRRARLSWFMRSSAIVAFIVINPQYVNISSLYSGSLMLLALIYSSLLLSDRIERDEQNEILRASVSFALISASLVALKHTIAPFAVPYFIVFFMLHILISRYKRRMASIAGITVTAAAIMLAPWFWSVYDKIAIFFHKFIEKISPQNFNQAHLDLNSHISSKLMKLSSSQKLLYGGNVSDYSFIVICTLIVAIWGGYLLVKKKGEVNSGSVIVIISAGISVPIVYLINGYFARTVDVGIRYTCPLIIASFPVIMLLLAGNSAVSQPVSGSYKTKINQLSVLLILVVGIGLFINGWFGRTNQLFEFRSMLSYPINKGFIPYFEYTFSKFARERVKSMQIKAEESSPILAWFEHSFLLDFKRNRIFTIGSPGIIIDVGGFTRNDLEDVDLFGSFLRSLGIRYVIWGYGETRKAPYRGTFELEQGLKALQGKHQIVYDDGRTVMIDING